ncbi:MAG: hypothetical protein GC129_03695 [Proteobacteria bacterium]|nr:hypothetical protein [Pseudomonadota bacterium]
MSTRDTLQELGQALVDDLAIESRLQGRTSGKSSNIDALAIAAGAAAMDKPLIYTAFDGDHQQLCSLMRRLVIAEGGVPVNPDSVLDYRETVLGRQTKRGVLLDDLAILRGCDQLWIFCDQHPSAEGLRALAEGVLVEILFFLKRKPQAPVFFLSAQSLLTGGNNVKTPLEMSYEDAKAALPEETAVGVLELANSGIKTDKELPSSIYYILDPMDYKYARFILPRAYQRATPRETFVPLVPYLAVQVGDAERGILGLGQIVLSWVRLAHLGAVCTMLPCLDAGRRESAIAKLLHTIWLRQNRPGPVNEDAWRAYGVPKANQGALWPITARERDFWKGMH